MNPLQIIGNQSSAQTTSLVKEADELAIALSKVTVELGKISGVFAAKAPGGGGLESIKPEDMPFIPAGGMPDIETVGKEIFITPPVEVLEASAA